MKFSVPVFQLAQKSIKFFPKQGEIDLRETNNTGVDEVILPKWVKWSTQNLC